jgi:hypothetical protein
VEDPTLCELLNGDVAFLVGVNFGNKSLVLCAYCIYLVLINLEFILYRSTHSSCYACKDHLQKSPNIIAQLLIQPDSEKISFYWKFRSSVGSSDPLELPTQCQKFRQI